MDQFHTRGLAATADLAKCVEPQPGMQVLDAGGERSVRAPWVVIRELKPLLNGHEVRQLLFVTGPALFSAPGLMLLQAATELLQKVRRPR